MITKNDFFIKKNYELSFELISIFIILIFNKNINSKISTHKKINEHILSIFISDLDESLRTIGIGDMSIGKYVKKYVKRFYYRLSKLHKNKSKNEIGLIDYFEAFKFLKEDKYEFFAKEIFKEINKFENIYNIKE